MSYFQATKLIDESGSAYGVKHIVNKPRVSSMPYLYDVAEGNVANHAAFRVFGYNADVDNVMEDIWPNGGTYIFPTSASWLAIASTSASDSASGAGTRTVDLHYLDAAYAEQKENITLDGTTPVITSASNILRVQHAHTQTSGSNGVTAGNISVTATSGSPTYAVIQAGINTTRQAIWTVPAGKTAYITMWQAGVVASATGHYGDLLLRTTSDFEGDLNAGIFQIKDIILTTDNSVVVPFAMPIKVPATADIKVSGISDVSNANAVMIGHFEGWYES